MSEEEFEAAARRIKNVNTKPSDDQLLQLYGLYKVATTGAAPSQAAQWFDVKRRAMNESWSAAWRQCGGNKKEAMRAYVILVNSLTSRT